MPHWKRILITDALLAVASIVAYVVRVLSGQFSKLINDILFWVLIVFMMVLVEGLYWINTLLNRYLPFKDSIPRRIAVQLISGALYALTLRFLLYEIGEPYLPVKLDSMFLAATWFLYILASLLMNGIFITGYFIDEWKMSLVRAERLEKEKTQVQFDNLKNQLNPHFLFNALTSLNSLIFENQGLASQFLQHLSKVYRYVLQNKGKNFVTVQTEMDFIQNYVFLLRTRFESALTISLNIHEHSKDKAIVPVTLQILIENALKHNVVDKDRPLSIRIETNDEYLVVSNNLQVRKLVETSNKQGLENLKSLYAFLTDKPVQIESSDAQFSVSVPLV
ncbi:MAG TPA: histidine kinase [Cyclobacteriaceae bacterium]|nr:histidine kinase [Cyclobacteriaceae bacterium]